MKEYLEEKLIQNVVNDYIKKENEQIEQECANLDEKFVQMAKDNKKIAKTLRKTYKKRRRNLRFLPVYKVVAVIAVMLLVFDVFFFTVPAVRNATIGLVNYVSDDYTDMGQPTKEWATGEADNNGLEQIKPEKEYRVTYLPEGMMLTDYSISYGRIYYNYIGQNDEYLSFMQEAKNISSKVDTEDAVTRTVSINGTDAVLVKKEEQTQIVFEMDSYMIKLIGTGLSDENLIQIAESIKEIKE